MESEYSEGIKDGGLTRLIVRLTLASVSIF